MITSQALRTGGMVAIVGAGPAGLMLARLLQTHGFSVRILERDVTRTSRSQGGSLDLRSDSGQRAIREANLSEAFDLVSRHEAKAFKLIDAQGNAIPGGGETHEDAGPEIDRGDLRQLLIDSLAPGTIAWGHWVTNVQPNGDGRWRLESADHPPVIADLVVGADGIGSKVRSRLTSVRPRYTGQTMIAATIRKDLWRGSELSDLLGEGSVMFAGGHKTIFVQRCSNDLILLYYSMAVAEDWPTSLGLNLTDTDAMLAAITQAYGDWSPRLMTMLTAVEGKLQRWPLSMMPPEYRWDPQPGLTMIGDAAHVMPPFTGKGVNLALFDALQLANALKADPAVEVAAAVNTFETGMQERTRKEIGECLEVGRNFYGIDMDLRERSDA